MVPQWLFKVSETFTYSRFSNFGLYSKKDNIPSLLHGLRKTSQGYKTEGRHLDSYYVLFPKNINTNLMNKDIL